MGEVQFGVTSWYFWVMFTSAKVLAKFELKSNFDTGNLVTGWVITLLVSRCVVFTFGIVQVTLEIRISLVR
jgi:hypothetical protein